MLTVHQLSKSYGQQCICNQFDFQMEVGQIITIIGPSGAGKTTFLRMLNHLELVDQGSISINGIDLVRDGTYSDTTTIRSYQKQIGLVFQDYQLFTNLSILDNLVLAPMAQGHTPQAQLLEQAKHLLNQLDLSDKADLKPNSLSGGQQQRVAIARALMLSPQFLCFDEPTSALDPVNTGQFAQLILELVQQPIGILIISHDTGLLDALGSQTQVMDVASFKAKT